MNLSNVLQIRELSVEFPFDSRWAAVVDRVHLDIASGRTLALVGESGCGKTVLGLSILKLVPSPGRITSGSIHLNGRDLLTLEEAEWQHVRGKKIGMVFQEPMTALNPVFTCGYQVYEVMREHEGVGRREGRARVLTLLQSVGIDDAERIYDAYPHELSGGLRQRVVIAMAMACGPDLIIADEPTTALDVTVQAQILHVLRRLQNANGMSLLLITHDFGVVAQIAHEVAVMYASEIVERGEVRRLLEKPAHPYTKGLLHALPTLERRQERLAVIPGNVPRAVDYPTGCHFAPRCGYATERCHRESPVMESVDDGHSIRCWNWKDAYSGGTVKVTL
jgi:peptide/nickel transport system ATP-binding protein